MSTPAESAATEAVVARFFDAIEHGDTATIADLYADDVIVWHNTDDVAQDKAASLALLGHLTSGGARMRYTLEHQTVVGEHVSRRHRVTFDAGEHGSVTMPASLHLVVRDGKIHEIHEYLDSAQTTGVVELLRRLRR